LINQHRPRANQDWHLAHVFFMSFNQLLPLYVKLGLKIAFGARSANDSELLLLSLYAYQIE